MLNRLTLVVALLPISLAQFLGGGGCGCAPPPACPSLPSFQLPQPCIPQISLPRLPPPCLPPLPQISIPQCPPPPPCPPSLPPISLPSLPTPCLPSLPAPSLPSLPSCGCGRKKRETPLPVIRGEAKSTSLCNNNTIRKIILKVSIFVVLH